jgi:hypothetical protein
MRLTSSGGGDFGSGLVSGFGRILLIAGLIGDLGTAAVHAQAVLGDPRDAPRIFAANCSACHKSPQGLAKSGQIGGFLRQHYTTGPEMSAAMAAYLVAAGSAPASKKGAATAENANPAAKTKGKKGEQLAAHPQTDSAEGIQQRTLRGKQPQAKALAAPPAAPAPQSPVEETKQTAALAAAQPAPAPAAAEPPTVLDIPMPAVPEGPPTDLVESYFSSSPLP